MFRPIYLFLCENMKRRSTLLICDEILLGELSCARKNGMKIMIIFGVNVINDLSRIVYFSEWYGNRVMFYLFSYTYSISITIIIDSYFLLITWKIKP